MKNSVPDSSIATGSVNTQASTRLPSLALRVDLEGVAIRLILGGFALIEARCRPAMAIVFAEKRNIGYTHLWGSGSRPPRPRKTAGSHV
jgi:hypothetical protein